MPIRKLYFEKFKIYNDETSSIYLQYVNSDYFHITTKKR